MLESISTFPSRVILILICLSIYSPFEKVFRTKTSGLSLKQYLYLPGRLVLLGYLEVERQVVLYRFVGVYLLQSVREGIDDAVVASHLVVAGFFLREVYYVAVPVHLYRLFLLVLYEVLYLAPPFKLLEGADYVLLVVKLCLDDGIERHGAIPPQLGGVSLKNLLRASPFISTSLMSLSARARSVSLFLP